MANIMEGTLKVRGTLENIKRFLIGLTPMSVNGNRPGKIIYDDYEFAISIEPIQNEHGFTRWFQLTPNCFIDSNCIWFCIDNFEEEEEEGIILIPEFRARWKIPTNELAQVSKEYNIDIKIYGFECGMCINQDVEIHKGKIIKDKLIKFDNYDWDCVMPNIGS